MKSERAEAARAYLDDGGAAVLKALDEVAGARDVPVPAVALAWLRAHPRVEAPIASARTVGAARADPPGGDARAHAAGGRPAVGLLALDGLAARRDLSGIDAQVAASHSRRVSRPQPISDERER